MEWCAVHCSVQTIDIQRSCKNVFGPDLFSSARTGHRGAPDHNTNLYILEQNDLVKWQYMIIGPQTQTRNVWNQSYVFKFKLLELFGVEAAIRSIGQLSQNLLKQLIEHLVSLEKCNGQSDGSDWILPPTFFFLSSPTVLRAAILLSMSETCQKDTVSKAASPPANPNLPMRKTSETGTRLTCRSRTSGVILKIVSGWDKWIYNGAYYHFGNFSAMTTLYF